MAHVDSRDSVRFKPDPCRYPVIGIRDVFDQLRALRWQ
jgi:hypothetical protein